ncbi:unnamed protein product, partial [Effrenium voratum]
AFTWANGSSYIGAFEQNDIHGIGAYKWADGRSYAGQWQQNRLHGYGEMVWTDGRSYCGCYEEDKKHGEGTFRWADGRQYAGQWQDGRQHGTGKYLNASNQVRSGHWQNGQRVKWLGGEREPVTDDGWLPRLGRWDLGTGVLRGLESRCQAKGDRDCLPALAQWERSKTAVPIMTYAYPSYGADETTYLLDKVQTKDDFHAKRWRCLSHPSRAFETLSPYAILEVGIMAARDLTERESGFFSTDTTPDTLVQVIMDDRDLERCITPVARGKKEPLWLYHCEVDVVAPSSMIRFQVLDDRPTQKAEIGFVDIAINDIPYDKVIEGWFELRFQENLLKTGQARYEEHCSVREEEKCKQSYEDKEKEKKSNSSTESTDLPTEDLEMKLVKKTPYYAPSKARAMDAFQSCVSSTADKAEEYGFETLSKSLKEGGRSRIRNNAGEVYISLRLKLAVSSGDSLFALALDPPAPVNLGTKEEVVLTRKVDIQRCYDDLWEVKVRVVDDAVLCCVYGFKYLVSWRSWPLSLIYLVGLIACCVRTYLVWAIVPLLLAISLFVNSFPKARAWMTRGGHNAALTEEGFKQTAAWRDTEEIFRFINRLLREDMKAKLEDPRGKLRGFAAQAIRDGEPAVTLEELRLALAAAPFVQVEDGPHFNKGDLVWVEGRWPAKVTAVGPEDAVTVIYEKTLVENNGAEPIQVRARQVVLRAEAVPKVPSWVGAGIAPIIAGIYPVIEDLRHVSLPAIHMLTQILTWANKPVALGLMVTLLVVSGLFMWAAILHITKGSSGNLSHSEEVVIMVLRRAGRGWAKSW